MKSDHFSMILIFKSKNSTTFISSKQEKQEEFKHSVSNLGAHSIKATTRHTFV